VQRCGKEDEGVQLKIAMIGDIVGRPGRTMVKQHLPRLRSEYGIDFVVANYENASHGRCCLTIVRPGRPTISPIIAIFNCAPSSSFRPFAFRP